MSKSLISPVLAKALMVRIEGASTKHNWKEHAKLYYVNDLGLPPINRMCASCTPLATPMCILFFLSASIFPQICILGDNDVTTGALMT